MSGGGGKGGWGSAVVSGEWFAASAATPFLTPVPDDPNGMSIARGMVVRGQAGDWNGALTYAENFPKMVVTTAPQSLGLAIGGGFIRAAGKWFGF